MRLPTSYVALVQALDQLPGIGQKAASRLAQHLLVNVQGQPLLSALQQAVSTVQLCQKCRSLCTDSLCERCKNPDALQSSILVLAGCDEQQAALELGWTGQFFILHGLLSPMLGIGPKQLQLSLLKKRLTEQKMPVIIAVDDSVEGRTTAQFIVSLLPSDVEVQWLPWPQWLAQQADVSHE